MFSKWNGEFEFEWKKERKKHLKYSFDKKEHVES